MKNSNKTLISIVGPTAIGKTDLAITLAKALQTEIISCDSRQFFKELKIGTAPPDEQDLDEVPHHFIHHLSIFDSYSVGDFERDALQKIDELFVKNDTVVMVGGSGLYEKAVTEGLDDFPEVDSSIRENLNALFEKEGIQPLQDQLKTLDPIFFGEIDRQNHKRLIRSLEICIGTGKPYSSFRTNQTKKRSFKTIKIGLNIDREDLYHRINTRVDRMMEKGLLEEAKQFYSHQDLNALQTVGYREFFTFFDGTGNLNFAIEDVKKNTRRFAKRQLTWFKKDAQIKWFTPEDVQKIKHYIKNPI